MKTNLKEYNWGCVMTLGMILLPWIVIISLVLILK